MEFRQVNEKRWLMMKKIAFYILERPVPVSKDGHEFKDDEEDGLAPVEVSVLCNVWYVVLQFYALREEAESHCRVL